MPPSAAPRFGEHTVAADLKGGYQVVAVDLNKDGRPDLVALASGMDELVWFENPRWQRHVIARGLSRMINAAPWDVDGDGIPELTLASGFSMEPSKSLGIVSVLNHRGDPREPWVIREIDRLPTSHRLVWVDTDGTGRKVAVNVPLAGAAAMPPDYRGKAPIVLYRPGSWSRELVSDDLEGVIHGVTVCDWDRDGREGFLAAGFEGIHLFLPAAGGAWSRTGLAKGNPEPWPAGGASEIAVGRLGERRFLCAIEPWHGHKLVVYLDRRGEWRRKVIDDTLAHGHALLTADLNGDGRDEIVAGFRGKERGLCIYSADDSAGERWTRLMLDGEIAPSSCVSADLNGDGRLDLACIGGSVLKWYENLGASGR